MKVFNNDWYGSWKPLTDLIQIFPACHLCTFNVATILGGRPSLHMTYWMSYYCTKFINNLAHLNSPLAHLCFPLSHVFFKDTTPVAKFKTSVICTWIMDTGYSLPPYFTRYNPFVIWTSTISTTLPLPPTHKLYTCISRGTQPRVGRQKGERGRSYRKLCCVYSTRNCLQ